MILVRRVKSLDVAWVGFYALNQSVFWESLMEVVSAYDSTDVILSDFNVVIVSEWDRSYKSVAGNLPSFHRFMTTF